MPYLVAGGSDSDAVDFYLQRRDINSALVMAKMSEGRSRIDSLPSTRGSAIIGISQLIDARSTLQPEDDDDRGFSLPGINKPNSSLEKEREREREREFDRLDQERDEDQASMVAKRELVISVNAQAAALYTTSSRPMLAAAQLLAVGDIDGAVRTLSACGEDDLAYVVSLCMDMDTDIYLIHLAGKMAAYQSLPAALDMLDGLTGAGHRGLHKDGTIGLSNSNDLTQGKY